MSLESSFFHHQRSLSKQKTPVGEPEQPPQGDLSKAEKHPSYKHLFGCGFLTPSEAKPRLMAGLLKLRRNLSE